MATMTKEEFEAATEELILRLQGLWTASESGRAASEFKTAMMYIRQARATEKAHRKATA